MHTNFIIPKLREDLTIDVVKENNQDLLLLVDPNGFAQQPVALPQSFLGILQLIDGNISLNEIIKKIKDNLDYDIDPIVLVDIISKLDKMNYLDSITFHINKFEIEYYKSLSVRPPVCSGNSYPSEPFELEVELDNILSSVNKDNIKPGAKNIIVPHIDFKIGKISHEVYASAYHTIRDSLADLFVIFGTAHYKNSDLFMLSEKDFKTPLGVVQTDKNIINYLKEQLGNQITIDELAHRYEHSIELQLVLLQHIFKHRDFTILPILTGSFDGYVSQQQQPNTSDRFYHFITQLNKAIKHSGRKAVFIASGDLAHIGRKFEDNFDAEPILSDLENEDRELINLLTAFDSEGFFSKISEVNNKRKICGLSPIYSLIESMKIDNNLSDMKAEFFKYHQWNEIETRSAVSFASIAYY